MEDLLRATVLEQRDPSAADVQLVVAAMSRAVGSFPTADALVAWSGGLALLHAELPQRFPRAAAIAISARYVELTRLSLLRIADARALCEPKSLQSIRLANSPLLESIAAHAFSDCVNLKCVDLADLPCLRVIGGGALSKCKSLQSIRLVNLPLLENIPARAFSGCKNLTNVDLSDLASLRIIGEAALDNCKSLQSIHLMSLPLFENIGARAFSDCVNLSTIDIADLACLHCASAASTKVHLATASPFNPFAS